jgi:hypothetical protein
MSTRKYWTQIEDDFIRENYKKLDNALLGKELKRNASSVGSRMRSLGLKRDGTQGLQRYGFKYVNYSHNWETNLDTPCCLLMPCTSCNELMPCESFYVLGSRGGSIKRKGRTDILGNKRSGLCLKCSNSYYLSHTNEKKMLYGARKRASETGRDFNITEKDIVIPENCPILGIRLIEGLGTKGEESYKLANSPTLDRVDNNLGYEKDNIVVISRRANVLKNDGSFEELLAIVAFLADWKTKGFNPNEAQPSYFDKGEDECVNILNMYIKHKKENTGAQAQ